MITTKSLAAWLCTLAILTACSHSISNPPARQPGLSQIVEQDEHCTVIYAADDQVALGGNNEDNYYAGLTHIWFIPPEQGRYGMALVGYDNFLNPEGAVNDHGLFFDGLAVRVVEIPQQEGAVPYEGNAIMKIMTECATVDCALAFFEKYSLGGSWNGQWLIGDSQGNSAIIEPAAIVRKEGPFQVATNFFQSEVPPAYRTDVRYVEATSMLRNADQFSVDLFRNTLDVVHQQSDGDSSNPPLHTQYSTIYDLRKGLIYLYYFHDFQHAVTFDLKQELAKGIHAYEIPSLFGPSATAQKIEAKYPARVAGLPAGLGARAVDPDLLRKYPGSYRIEALQSYLDGEVQVKSEAGRLFLRNPWMPWVEAVPQADGDFVYRYMDPQNKPHQMAISFMQDASGQVTGMQLAMDDGPQVPAGRVTQAGEPAQDPGAQAPAEKAAPDRTQLAGLGVFLLLALFVAGWGIKALRSKGP